MSKKMTIEQFRAMRKKIESDVTLKAESVKRCIVSFDNEYNDINEVISCMFSNFDLFFPEYVEGGVILSEDKKRYIVKMKAKEDVDNYYKNVRPQYVKEYFELTGVKLK